jgi:hypothetical protein
MANLINELKNMISCVKFLRLDDTGENIASEKNFKGQFFKRIRLQWSLFALKKWESGEKVSDTLWQDSGYVEPCRYW